MKCPPIALFATAVLATAAMPARADPNDIFLDAAGTTVAHNLRSITMAFTVGTV
jgi:hypothetical protein